MDEGQWLQQMRAELEAKKAQLEEKENALLDLRAAIDRLGTAIAAMEGTLQPVVSRGVRGQRRISPAARQRIVEAQKRRWERIRREKQASLKGKLQKASQEESDPSSSVLSV